MSTGSDTVAAGWVRLKLIAELVEDAHPGSGAGGGGIDALIARDRDGHPVIWSSHVEGLLRDAALRLRGKDVARAFFGGGGGDRQRAIFTSLYTKEDPTCRVWRSTARASFENRAPNDDTLRAVEFVPKGTIFEGEVEIPSEDLPLLRRLIQEIDAVGRGRATGAGRVKLTLKELLPAPRAVGAATTSRLLLLLRNLDPMCITATATPDNLIPTLPFIPGRTLVGAVAAWLLAQGERDVAATLVNGQVSVSDALPLPSEPGLLTSVEVCPAPLSLQSQKPGGVDGGVPWWALPITPIQRVEKGKAVTEGDEPKKLKRPEADLFACRQRQGSRWTVYRPQQRVRLRNGRPDPSQADPMLFAIEQIAERTCFLTELRGEVSEMVRLCKALRPVLEGGRWLRVGRAGAPVEVIRVAWARPQEPLAVGTSATLTLTSDLLARDRSLRWLTALDGTTFQKIPGWPDNVTVTPIVQDQAPVNGFNGTSRLRRLPAAAVRRGSVFRVEGPGVAQLARSMAEGRWLGERTQEGFGRFRLDDVLPGVSTGDTLIDAITPVPDDPAEVIAKTTQSWFEAHRRLAKAGGSATRRPSLSQWLDLVSDLQRGAEDALSSRKQPTTVGKQSWLDHDARAILDKLDKLGTRDDREAHARMFMRWLRAEMRKEAA